ncbi:unnamed protein product [Cuscuta epithymum]|uniref:F-box domain-containing protein n=1 Tax=Cuscuta epithymum TaxID=186058 RepID=A0AAV0FRI7_9ASTE|nr:unnamed protein product [Cuscuta epithymum]
MMTTACESRKKQTREEDAPEGIHNLTDDLLTEILLRLSRRQALQYRLVCKGWYSIISSPRFTRLSNLRLGFPINLVFQTPGNLPIPKTSALRSILLRSAYRVNREFGFDFLPDPNVRLVGSSANFMLCARRIPGGWCPLLCLQSCKGTMDFSPSCSTRPTVCFLCRRPSECRSNQAAEGVKGSSHTKFMVLRFLTPKSNHSGSTHFKALVLSSEDLEWRALDVSRPPTVRYYSCKTPLVAYRGALHKLYNEIIMVYDPFNSPHAISRIIHLPFLLPHGFSIGLTCCFGVFRGRLRIARVCSESHGVSGVDPAIEIWELGDYNSGLWNLVQKVHLKGLSVGTFPLVKGNKVKPWLRVLYFHPLMDHVLYLGMQTRGLETHVIHFDIKTRKLRRLMKNICSILPSLRWTKIFRYSS